MIKIKNKVNHKKNQSPANLLRRISINSDICHGKPCIRGHRIMVYQILELVGDGVTFDKIIRDYFPTITKEDIQACIEYAQYLVKNEDIHLV